jgi:hypothetical protein
MQASYHAVKRKGGVNNQRSMSNSRDSFTFTHWKEIKMTTRKMFTVLLIANLLTVAIVTAAVQADRLLAFDTVPQAGNRATINHDPLLVPVVPWTMNYQGILKDSGGTPLNGQHDLTFTIYRWDQSASQYANVWTETHNDVQITDGLFSVALGAKGSPLRGDVFTGMGVNGTWDGDLALGIRVDGGAELSPRTTLETVPYAHRAEYVNRFPAPHYDSGWVPAPGSPTWEKTLTHNLGGNTDDYIVDLQFKDTRNPGSLGIHQFGYGGDADDVQHSGTWGAWWNNLTTSQIQVWWGSVDTSAGEVRVRIWRTQ